jgi:hypothetical protein
VQWNLINEINEAGDYHFIPRTIQEISSSKLPNMMPTIQQQQQQQEGFQQSSPDITPFQQQLLCLSTSMLPPLIEDNTTATTSTRMMLDFKHHSIHPTKLEFHVGYDEDDGSRHSDFFEGRRFFFVDE